MLYYIRFFRMCQNLCGLCIQAYLCSKKFRNGNFSRFFIMQIPKWEFFMLFGCKNAETGIFLDNFHKIYQNGNYKREVIEMVTRMEYLQKLLDWKDEKVIKVITGIRRCGKSTLLLQYQEHLKEQGIDDSQIISVNFEDLQYEELLDYKTLYDYIQKRLCKDKMTYIF